MRYIFIFIFLIMSFSCKEESVYTILKFKNHTKVNVSEIISDIEYIRLETNDSCKIGYIKQILEYNDNFYILDAPVGKAIFVFDKEGNFLNKIDSQGQGPGEYVMPFCISINKVQNKLYVQDVMQNKMLIYNAKTLEFLDEYFLDVEANSFCFIDNDSAIAWYNTLNIICKNTPHHSHIITTDLKNNFLKEMIPIEFETGYILNPFSPFSQSGLQTFLTHPYNGIIYELSKTDSKELYGLDFENHEFPPMDFLKKNKSNNNFIKIVQESGYINFSSFYQSHNHICVSLYASDSYYMSVFNKERNRGIYFSIDRVIDDLGIGDFDIPSICVGDSYYSIIKPYNIIESRAVNSKTHAKLSEIVEKIKEDDNPILLKYKIVY